MRAAAPPGTVKTSFEGGYPGGRMTVWCVDTYDYVYDLYAVLVLSDPRPLKQAAPQKQGLIHGQLCKEGYKVRMMMFSPNSTGVFSSSGLPNLYVLIRSALTPCVVSHELETF